MVPAGKVFMHGLGGGSPHRVCVLPNLIRDIDQRDYNSKRTDDLSEIGEVIEIHVRTVSSCRASAPLAKPKSGKSEPDWHYAVALQFVTRL